MLPRESPEEANSDDPCEGAPLCDWSPAIPKTDGWVAAAVGEFELKPFIVDGTVDEVPKINVCGADCGKAGIAFEVA